jgi:hypothetical protein
MFPYSRQKNPETKPKDKKALFRMNLSDKGALTVETATKIITLTKTQTEALRSFLMATKEA